MYNPKACHSLIHISWVYKYQAHGGNASQKKIFKVPDILGNKD